MNRYRLLAVALTFFLSILGSQPAVAAEQPAAASLILKLMDGLTAADTSAVIAGNGGVEISSIPALRLHVIAVPIANLPVTLQNFEADARVESVELNKLRKVEGIPVDPKYGVQWAWPKIGWESVFGTVYPTRSVKVAIIDTGIDASHPDLAGNVIPGRSILDETNGLNDPHGHGTSLAGIVAALTDNGEGIAGIGYAGVRIMPVVALGANGTGQDSDIISAIIWAADQGADVILMGFSNADFSHNLQDAIDYAWSKGAVLVAATGNDGVNTPTFPAGDRGVVGVSATDRDDGLASASNYGQDVFLAAPGTDIYTTTLGNSYGYISGTSASSAIVAGVAAFMKAVDPSLTNGIIVGRLGRSADYAGVVGDPDNQSLFGNGRVNVAGALADTSTESVQPAGAAPIGGGGPYIGPYAAAGGKELEIYFIGSGGGAISFYDFDTTLPDCTESCIRSLNNNDVGTITAVPNLNSVFAGWSSTFALATTTCVGGTNPCTISIYNNGHQMNAQFNLRPVITNVVPNSRTFGDPGFTMSLTGVNFVPGAIIRINDSSLATTFTSSTELTATVSADTVSAAGTHSITVVNPDGGISDPQALTVAKATPTITWGTPSDIVYNTPLSGTQLNATASVSGTFTYSPAAGAVLNAGGSQTLSVIFTPTDAGNYTTATATVQINVAKATPTISWSNPTDMVYGTPLSAAQLNAMTPVGGTFAYSPAAGAVLSVGNGQTLSATFTPGDAANYTTASASVQLNVTKATPTISWTNPADIAYGTPLSGTHLNATAPVPGTFSYSPAAGAVLKAGSSQTLSVIFTPADVANYTTATATVQINVTRAAPTVSWTNPADMVYGVPLGAMQLNATASVPGVLTYTPAAGTVLPAGNGQTLSVTFTPADAENYTTATVTVQIGVLKATPVIGWSNPAGIVYGTALSGMQLNASASVPGTFTYTPGAGTVLSAGSVQTLSVTFTPGDAGSFTTATATVQINVAKATPLVLWSHPGDIGYGAPLSATQLNATASVAGAFVYNPATGTVLNAGNGQSLGVTFTPADAVNYTTATAAVQINVAKANSTISWSNPVDIGYGTPLTGTQLNATASVPGTFSYTPAAGAVLNAGSGQVLSGTFTPTDALNYAAAAATVQINVAKAVPTISWSNPATIAYGTPLGATQLNASASVSGTFAYSPSAGTMLNVGSGQTLSVTFTPADPANHTTVTAAAVINVNRATPTITWSSPADIVYGFPLSATQLNATASVSGTFAYNPGLGTVLNAGSDQTLSVTFTPTDGTSYSSATASVQINVDRAIPTINWSNPADIGYGTPLSGIQLNATASVPGTFNYSPGAGTLLIGSGQTLIVTFIPADSVNYMTAIGTVQINVVRGTPIISWKNPADIGYGTPLTGTQLNATASVPGTFSYTPAAGVSLPAGSRQTLSVTFTPDDTIRYTSASATVPINVNKATPAIIWNNPADIYYGTALGAVQLNAATAGNLPGTFVYSPAAGAVLGAGNGKTLTATFMPTDASNYNTASGSVQINIRPGVPVPVGEGVSVSPVAGVQVTFTTVTSPGDATADPVSNLPAPASYTITGGSSYDIATTSIYSGPVTVCVKYDSSFLINQAYKPYLKLFRLNGSSWEDVTVSVDTESGTLCAVTSSLATFAIAEPKLVPACGASSSISVPTSNATGTFPATWGISSVGGVTYVVEASKDGGAYNQIYSGLTNATTVTILENGSYVFRVKATKAGYLDSAWKTSATVAVALVCGTPATLNVPTINSTGSFRVSWGISNVAGVTYVVESSFSGGPWTTAYSGSGTSTTLIVTADGSYTFRVKAMKPGFADSAWKNSGSLIVTLVCGAPATMSIPSSNTTGNFQAGWGSSNVPGGTYVLEWSKDGGAYQPVFTGQNTSTAVTIAEDGGYIFRVKATKPGYADSAWKYSGSLTVTLVCGAPSTLNVPISNSTGTFLATWGVSNVTGVTYMLEGSKDGGAYTQIYSGSGTSATVTGLSEGSYLFRVKAIRADYRDSAWKVSTTVPVALVCGTPATISVPTSNSTGSFPVSWTASNVAGVTYLLESSFDGGSWTSAYSGPNNFATVAVAANGSYTLRVKAVKTGFADSGWKTSASIAVVLVCGAPSNIIVPTANTTGIVPISWKASDVAEVTYLLEYSTNGGGSYMSAYSGPDTSVTIPLQADGIYLFRVKATRTGYAESGWKNSAGIAVSLICGAPSSITVPASNSTGSLPVSWVPSDVAGVTYILESSRNGGSYAVVYSGLNPSATVAILDGGVYLFRVKATRSGYADSGWKYSGDIAVSLVCGTPATINVPVSNATGSFPATWGISNVAGVTYVLETSRNGGTYVPVSSGPNTSTTATIVDDGAYIFRVKATRVGYADSDWRYSGTVAVALVCGTPASITVPESNTTGSLQVAWGISSVAGVTYTLESSRDGVAYTPVYSGPDRSATVMITDNGTFVFRVMAARSGYADSDWKYSGSVAVALACGASVSISVPVSNTTGSFQVTWGISNVAGATYILEASKNGAAYSVIYSGASTFTTVTGLTDGDYTLRVKATRTGYVDSAWKISDTVSISLVCGTPATITVPAGNSTGSFLASWGVSNVSGVTYVLESSVDGAAWTAVYSGPRTTATVSAVTDGSYVLRLKAVKADYADSSWKISAPVVVNLL